MPSLAEPSIDLEATYRSFHEDIAAASVIQKNGGLLTSQGIAENGRPTARYWIDL